MVTTTVALIRKPSLVIDVAYVDGVFQLQHSFLPIDNKNEGVGERGRGDLDNGFSFKNAIEVYVPRLLRGIKNNKTILKTGQNCFKNDQITSFLRKEVEFAFN